MIGLKRFTARHSEAVTAIINARNHQIDEMDVALKIFDQSKLPYTMEDVHKAFEEADEKGGLT